MWPFDSYFALIYHHHYLISYFISYLYFIYSAFPAIRYFGACDLSSMSLDQPAHRPNLLERLVSNDLENGFGQCVAICTGIASRLAII